MAASVALPPGFRFHPTDEELVGYYLHRKAGGLEIELEVIPVLDLYKFEPWQLPEKSFLPHGDMEWFFFCPRDLKYPNGSRTNRATKTGYWKATGKDRRVVCTSSVTGFRKTLVFHRGRAPVGDRTEWMMHEYRICDESSPHSSTAPGAFSLCRVMKKTDVAQKNEIRKGNYGSHMGFNDFSSIITDKSYSISDYFSHGKEHKAPSPPHVQVRGGERSPLTSPYMVDDMVKPVFSTIINSPNWLMFWFAAGTCLPWRKCRPVPPAKHIPLFRDDPKNEHLRTTEVLG